MVINLYPCQVLDLFLDLSPVFHAIEFAGLTTDDTLHLGTTSEATQTRFFYIIRFSDVILMPVKFSGCPVKLSICSSYQEMSGMKISSNGIFINVHGRLHVYGN